MSGNCQCLSTDEKYHMLRVITIPTLEAFDNFNGGNHSLILNDMSSLSYNQVLFIDLESNLCVVGVRRSLSTIPFTVYET